LVFAYIISDVYLQGYTALMFASGFGHTDVVSFLLDHGAFVNAVNLEGNTALMWAAKENHKKTVIVLLKHGADGDCSNSKVSNLLTTL
jgi:ankyrin repeat protein